MSYDSVETSARGGAPVELFRFSIGTGVVYTLTSADEEVTFLGDLYVPEAVSRSEIDQNGEAEQGAVEVLLPRTHPAVVPFIAYSPEPAMSLVIYRKHRSDAGFQVLFTGTVSSAVFQGPSARLTCLPIFAVLRHRIPRNTCQAQCNWALYSAQCGVAKSAFQVSATLASVSGDTIVASVFSTKPDGWFNNGFVERANGERRWVVSHVGTTLTLLSAFIGLAGGEAVIAFAGCDRTEAACSSKFSNIARHLGFARVPTRNPFGPSGVS